MILSDTDTAAQDSELDAFSAHPKWVEYAEMLVISDSGNITASKAAEKINVTPEELLKWHLDPDFLAGLDKWCQLYVRFMRGPVMLATAKKATKGSSAAATVYHRYGDPVQEAKEAAKRSKRLQETGDKLEELVGRLNSGLKRSQTEVLEVSAEVEPPPKRGFSAGRRAKLEDLGVISFVAPDGKPCSSEEFFESIGYPANVDV